MIVYSNFEIVLSDLNDSTDFASQTIDLITQKITNYNYNLQFSDRPYAIDTSNLNSEINYDTTTENMLHEKSLHGSVFLSDGIRVAFPLLETIKEFPVSLLFSSWDDCPPRRLGA